MMDDMGGWSWIWMSAMMVLFWGALIIFGVWMVRSITGRKDSPLEIAQERFARGEISGDQFEQIRRDLNKTA